MKTLAEMMGEWEGEKTAEPLTFKGIPVVFDIPDEHYDIAMQALKEAVDIIGNVSLGLELEGHKENKAILWLRKYGFEKGKTE